jgi:hypothetical protein
VGADVGRLIKLVDSQVKTRRRPNTGRRRVPFSIAKSTSDRMAESNSDEISGIFEEELHLPSGFFKTLLHEDDWSFII